MSYESYARWSTTPLETDPQLSIVIPAFNESERIVPTIAALASSACALGVAWELIVVDDGSQDGTADLVESFGLVNARVLRAESNGGKGSAVRSGVGAARGDAILFADADGSTPAAALATMLEQLGRGGEDVVIASRAGEGAVAANRNPMRRLMTFGLRVVVRHILGIRVRDTQCGFKLFTRDAARRLFSAQTIEGFSFDLEILFLASRARMRVAEVPVHWVDAPGSKVDPAREARKFLRDLVTIRRNAMRGDYAWA